MEKLLGIKDVVLLTFYFHPAIEKKYPEGAVLFIKAKMFEYIEVVEPLRGYPDVCVSVGLDVDLLIRYFNIIVSICDEKLRPTGHLEHFEMAMENTIAESSLLSNLLLTAMNMVGV